MDVQDPLAEKLKAELIATIQEFFDEHLRPEVDAAPSGIANRGLQLATAVLLLEMTRVDFEIAPEERELVSRTVERVMGLNPEETAEILLLAEEQVKRSVPLHEFARLIDQEFSLEQKKAIVELMWRIAFSDAQILAQEEYLVRKVSTLLNLPLADFLEAKIRARDAFLNGA
jgi:uncharacterized tellurite resistance protein B-like protein